MLISRIAYISPLIVLTLLFSLIQTGEAMEYGNMEMWNYGNNSNTRSLAYSHTSADVPSTNWTMPRWYTGNEWHYTFTSISNPGTGQLVFMVENDDDTYTVNQTIYSVYTIKVWGSASGSFNGTPIDASLKGAMHVNRSNFALVHNYMEFEARTALGVKFANGTINETYSPPLDQYHLPLIVGATWTEQSWIRSEWYIEYLGNKDGATNEGFETYTFRVTDYSLITVPAGQFYAYSVETGNASKRVDYLNYSAGNFVRMEFYRSGNLSMKFDLNAYTYIPPAPEFISEKVTSSTITVTWNPTPDIKFLKYELYIQQEGQNDWMLLSVIKEKSSTSYTATGLNPSTKYYFKLKVVNTQRLSSESLPYETATGPEPVTGLNYSSPTVNGYILSWQKSTDPKFLRYELYFSENLGSIGTRYQQIEDREQIKLIITTLQPSSKLFVNVRIVNIYEKYADSEPLITYTKPTSVNILSHKIKDSTVTITWSNSTNKNIKNFEIYVSDTENTIGQKFVTVTNPNATSTTFSGLTPERIYYITVRIVNEGNLYNDSMAYKIYIPSSSTNIFEKSGFVLPVILLAIVIVVLITVFFFRDKLMMKKKKVEKSRGRN